MWGTQIIFIKDWKNTIEGKANLAAWEFLGNWSQDLSLTAKKRQHHMKTESRAGVANDFLKT